MDPVIREPGPADADEIGRMHVASWREAYAGLLPADLWTAAAEHRRIEGWRRLLEHAPADATTRIAVRDGRVVGLAGSGPGRPNETAGEAVRDRELWSIYVLASEHGTGLASRLLEAVLPAAVPAQLWVFEANPRARAFYGKHGFRPDGARHVFGPEYGDQPEIRMVR